MNEKIDKEEIIKKLEKLREMLQQQNTARDMDRYESITLFEIASKIADKCPYCPLYGDCKCEEEYYEDCIEKIRDWMYAIISNIDWYDWFAD